VCVNKYKIVEKWDRREEQKGGYYKEKRERENEEVRTRKSRNEGRKKDTE
jgi:predicted cupin superfamily sugar epimerase